jgi:hypothetical protein
VFRRRFQHPAGAAVKGGAADLISLAQGSFLGQLALPPLIEPSEPAKAARGTNDPSAK